MERERILWFGSIAGLLAGVLLVLSAVLFLVLGLTVPRFDPVSIEAYLMRFPEARAGYTLANAIALAGFVLTIPFVLALYRGFRETGGEIALGSLEVAGPLPYEIAVELPFSQ